ncbi:MAG TPA: MYXO-CTERM sorting domain-containing protein [Polyangiaceae bacterium]|nr:MYXO-CTERM sorting domain-containing protein [Polyangiaceae bacterium]
MTPTRLRTRVASIAITCWALTAATTSPANACTAPPMAPHAHFKALSVPANGAVAITYVCYDECDTFEVPEELSLVQQGTSTEITGTIEQVLPVSDTEATLIWKPDAPLVAGATYRLEAGLDASIYAELQVTEAVTVDLDALEPIAEVRLVALPHGERVCCPVTAEMVGSCGAAPCIHLEKEGVVALNVAFGAGFDGEASQLLGRLTGPGDAAEAVVWGSAAQFEVEQASSYCYELEVESLVDGQTRSFSEVCVEHGTVGEPGVEPTTAAEIEEGLSACFQPPEGYEDAWCAGVTARCEATPTGGGCDLWASTCEDTGSGGSSGSAGAPATGGSGAGGSGTGGSGGGTAGTSNPEEPEGSEDDGGCSMPGRPAGSSAWLALAAALGLAAQRVRRRNR